MEIRAIGALLRRGWLVIVIATVVGAAAGAGLSLWTAPVYTATAQIYVSVQATPSTTDLLQGSNFARQQVASYVVLATTPLVLDPVVSTLGLGETSDELAGRVVASNPTDTSLVTITATASHAADSATLADAVADSLSSSIQTLETPAVGGTSTVKASVVRKATTPSAPSSPKPKYNVAIGLLAGLALGVAGAVLRDVLDTRIRGSQDLEQVTGRVVLGSIAAGPDERPGAPVFTAAASSHRTEDYRRLRTSLEFIRAADVTTKVVVVTSAHDREGKTTTAVNLALALTEAGSRVALVDADLRRPGVAPLLGLQSDAGLSTVLAGRAELADVLIPWGPSGLVLLPSGTVPPNPVELLSLPALSRAIRTLSAEVEWVIIDSAPVGPVTDAVVVARESDAAVLFVVRNGVSRRGSVAAGLRDLAVVDAPLLGLVLNGIRVSRDGPYAYQSYGRQRDDPSLWSDPTGRTVADTRPRRHGTSRISP